MLVTTRSGSSVLRRKAFAPTSIVPSLPIHTALGVMRLPSSLANRIGNPESTMPTAELVVPKSIPRIMSLIARESRGAEDLRQRLETRRERIHFRQSQRSVSGKIAPPCLPL